MLFTRMFRGCYVEWSIRDSHALFFGKFGAVTRAGMQGKALISLRRGLGEAKSEVHKRTSRSSAGKQSVLYISSRPGITS